eukprot:9321359-Lingulodinium_polyedra.AAC.1
MALNSTRGVVWLCPRTNSARLTGWGGEPRRPTCSPEAWRNLKERTRCRLPRAATGQHTHSKRSGAN